jgi:Na+-translocating ferredoxin:NAD+ oxidoreductase RnfD subunit
VFSDLANATELLEAHIQKLSQAESTASEIHENLDRAAEAVKSWSESLPVGSGIMDWAFRIGTPLATLILGNYGITPTWNMNVVFLLGGMFLQCEKKESS